MDKKVGFVRVSGMGMLPPTVRCQSQDEAVAAGTLVRFFAKTLQPTSRRTAHLALRTSHCVFGV